MCDRWVNLTSINHNQIIESYQHFYLICQNAKQNEAWKGVWLVIGWEIWKHKNNIIFRQEKVDMDEV